MRALLEAACLRLLQNAQYAQDVFTSMDTDGSGYLDPPQLQQLLRRVLPHGGADSLRLLLCYLQGMDTHGDGRFSFAEFMMALHAVELWLPGVAAAVSGWDFEGDAAAARSAGAPLAERRRSKTISTQTSKELRAVTNWAQLAAAALQELERQQRTSGGRSPPKSPSYADIKHTVPGRLSPGRVRPEFEHVVQDRRQTLENERLLREAAEQEAREAEEAEQRRMAEAEQAKLDAQASLMFVATSRVTGAGDPETPSLSVADLDPELRLKVGLAAATGDVDEVIAALEANKGERPGSPDVFQETPLHIACMFGHLDVAKFLIEKHHVAVDPPNWEGWTPMCFAITRGHVDVVKYLISKRADVKWKTAAGLRPLHLASTVNNMELVQLLLKSGAQSDVKVETAHGIRAWACSGQPHIQVLLKK